MASSVEKHLKRLVLREPEKAQKLIDDYEAAVVRLAREDSGVFCEYVLRDELTNAPIVNAPAHETLHELIANNDRLVIWAHPELGKAVPLSTAIPTPCGWKAMGDLKEGDQVFDARGAPTEVLWAGPTQHNRVYELTFDDGGKAQADEGHLWLAHHAYDRLKEPRRPRMVDTKTLVSTLRVDQGARAAWSIALAGAVQYPEKVLPVHPYVLGAWLGDGTSSAADLTFHLDDRFIFDRCDALAGGGGRVAPAKGRPHIGRGHIGGAAFRAALRGLGVMGGKGSKFIPLEYMQGSIEQRRELLAGMMDTDGTFQKSGTQASFVALTFCDRVLGRQALELVRSLGFKARIRSKPAKVYGRQTSTAYTVTFTARVPVFHLPRKLAQQRLGPVENSKANYRTIVSAREVPSVPTRCIKVASADGTFLMGRDYTVTHNCELAGAKVLLADGSWKNIETIREPVEIATYHKGRWEKAKAGPAAPQAELMRCYEVELADGRLLRASYNHPFAVPNQQGGGATWQPCSELRPGMSLLVADCLPDVSGEGGLSPEEAALAGFLAHGTFVGKQGRIFSPSDPAERQRLIELCAMMGWKVWASPAMGQKVLGVRTEGDLTPEDVSRLVLTTDYRQFQTLRPVIFRSSAAAIREFCRSYFARRDAFAEKRPMFTLPWQGPVESEGYAKGIQRLLLRLGVQSKVYLDLASRQTAQGKGEYVVALRNPEDVEILLGTAPIPTRTEPIPVPIEVIRPLGVCSTWALPVHHPSHSYVSSGVLSHNTYHLAIGYPLWRLGNNPNMTVMVLSSTKDMAQKIIGRMKTLIETSEELHRVFPSLKPGKKWAEFAFTVQRESDRKDPSVVAAGLHTGVQGARVDLLVMDDVDTADTTRTLPAQKEAEHWVRTGPMSRLSDAAKVLGVGNVWNSHDLLHTFAAQEGWESRRFPVLDPQGNPTWPERFSRERVNRIRDVDLGPFEFRRTYMCDLVDESESRFKREWIEVATQRGAGKQLLEAISHVGPGYAVFTGVDLGVRTNKSSDPTAMVTVVLHPGGDLEIVDVRAGTWDVEQICSNLTECHRQYDSLITVESNGAQDFLVQIMKRDASQVPIKSFFTGKNKHDPRYGVEALAHEIASGQWIFPSLDGTISGVDRPLKLLVDEMLAYAPSKHTGDRLMALWIAREAARASVGVQNRSKAWVGRLRLGARR